MAFALAHAAASAAVSSIDLESLLWELRDLVRGLGQVNATQAAQLSALSASAPYDSVSAEYAERTQAALEAVDVALNQLQFSPSATSRDAYVVDDESEFDDTHVRAWLQATQLAMVQPETVTAEVSSLPSPLPAAPEPADFWATDSGFKWDEEPEVEVAQSPLIYEPPVQFDDSVSTLDDEAVGPWDSISERDVASSSEYSDEDEQDSVPEVVRGDSFHGDDSATLFHSEPAAPQSQPQQHDNTHRPHVFTTPSAAKVARFGFSAEPAMNVLAEPASVLAGF